MAPKAFLVSIKLPVSLSHFRIYSLAVLPPRNYLFQIDSNHSWVILITDHVGYCRYEKLSWPSTTLFWLLVKRKPTLDRFLPSLFILYELSFKLDPGLSLLQIILFFYVAC